MLKPIDYAWLAGEQTGAVAAEVIHE
jgi:hypothetical protein